MTKKPQAVTAADLTDVVEALPLNLLRYASDAPKESGIVVNRTIITNDMVNMMRDSIVALGQIVPMIYQLHNSLPYVIDGNLRLAALHKIHGPNSDTLVQAMNVAHLGHTPAEIALAATIIRSPLHMVDKYESFAALVQAGQEPVQIAVRFSIKAREVEQALAVARLAPEVRTAWRAGEVNEATAEAFTIEPDQKRQASLFRKLKKDGDLSDWNVRRAIVGDNHDVAKLLAFATPEAYEAAGGVVLRDLFKDRHGVSDMPLLKRVADERLARACTEQPWSKGWGFVVPEEHAPNYHSWRRTRLAPVYAKGDKAAMAALTKQIDAIDDQDDVDDDLRAKLRDQLDLIEEAASVNAWPLEQRAKAGCIVSIGDTGRINVHPGFHMPGNAKATAGAAQPQATPADKKKAAKEREKKASAGEVSKALDQRLAVQMRRATKRALEETAKAWASETGVNPLPAFLAGLAAGLIKPENNNTWNEVIKTEQMDTIRAGIDPEVMNAQCLKAFDAKDYFDSIPKANMVAVVKDTLGADEAGRVGKLQVAAIKKFMLASVAPTGWLPPQMRTIHYAGAAGGGAKAAAKKKARRK